VRGIFIFLDEPDSHEDGAERDDDDSSLVHEN
jgi:hypothetical protein